MPILKELPYTHRYWLEFRDQYFPNEPEVTASIANMIMSKLEIIINRVKDMTDDEFSDCECKDAKPCLAFHDPQYPVIIDFSLAKDLRQKVTLIDDSVPTVNVEVINKNTLENPLIIEQHYLYGGTKLEIRYTDQSETEIETVIERI